MKNGEKKGGKGGYCKGKFRPLFLLPRKGGEEKGKRKALKKRGGKVAATSSHLQSLAIRVSPAAARRREGGKKKNLKKKKLNDMSRGISSL